LLKNEKNRLIKFFIVLNIKGLHARPATVLAKYARNFTSKIILIYQGKFVNAKSMVDILTLAATRGAKVNVYARGVDAEEALNTIISLARNRFDVDC
jgi:phosphocarrier protein